MQDNHRSIFRAKAVQRYVEGQDATIVPRFVPSVASIYLWILAGLLVVGGFACWSTLMPLRGVFSALF